MTTTQMNLNSQDFEAQNKDRPEFFSRGDGSYSVWRVGLRLPLAESPRTSTIKGSTAIPISTPTVGLELQSIPSTHSSPALFAEYNRILLTHLD
jgi:hypothetical protein